MKEFVLNKCMNIIKKEKNYDKTKLAEIKYGLEGMYLMITKLIIISIIAIILGIFKELLLFLLIYTFMRAPSFGIHASKSWICLISSTIIFIEIPIIMKNININATLKLIIGILSTIHICIYSPADTHKKPIVNKTRRKIYKILSTIISSIYIIISLIIKNQYIANCFLFSTLLQNILISPITYKIFKLPYNNYKTYMLKHGLN